MSVGNIGQLAVDLLISSLQLVKFARLDHPVFLPVVGSDPYSHREAAGLTTAAECELSDIFQPIPRIHKKFCYWNQNYLINGIDFY